MIIYYGGCEQPGWRSFLADQGVITMSLSWYGLRRRRADLSGYRIRDEFPAGVKVYLDSGAYSVNKDENVGRDEAYALYQEYMDFVDRNIEDVYFASEFDAQVLGQGLIEDVRARYWSQKDPMKWMPVWHSETGVTDLRILADAYERVGVLQSAEASSDIAGVLHSLRRRTSFHGVSMTKINAMKTLPLDSVGSTSWLSPTQYGDTFIWDGQELHRYPRDYKHRRASHRQWLRDQGFDTEKIEGDDSNELLRLSVWSWQAFAKSLSGHSGVTPTVLDPFSQIVETDPTGVVINPPEPRNNTVALREERVLLPLFTTDVEVSRQADGTEVRRRVMRSPGTNLLQCNTCHINDVCPGFRADHECLYEIPVEIRTSTQLSALQDTLIELQTQRVLRATMFEQVRGGSLDKAASEEYDRLQRMITRKIENAKEGVSIKIEATGTGAPGFVSNIFGRDAGDRVTELPTPLAIESILDAEIVEG